jgi:hypothetical protein
MKRIFLALAVMIGVFFFSAAVPLPAYAADESCDANVFGMPAWYNGMMTKGSSGDCEFEGVKNGDKIDIAYTGFKIGANILRDFLVVSVYVSLFFIIKGGFMYMLSAGSPEGISSAKKTIQNAVIGFVIALISVQLVNVIGDII